LAGTRRKIEQQDVLTLTELEQIRVLADPLRVRIIEVLCRGEHTTKQVAEKLGEKPTKLYHHVEALERVGLIRQTRTRRNRGTLERYYLAVARAFRADSTLFSNEQREGDETTIKAVVDTLLQRTGEELNDLAAAESRGARMAEQAVISFCELEASQATIDRYRKRIMRLLKDLQTEADTEEDAERRFRLTLAYYPLDQSDNK
jgi:DNA-binding transcriptional ArsR family regulator